MTLYKGPSKSPCTAQAQQEEEGGRNWRDWFGFGRGDKDNEQPPPQQPPQPEPEAQPEE